MTSIHTETRRRFVQYATAITLALTVLTGILLFVSSLRGSDPTGIVTDIHAWVAIAWVVVASINFVFAKNPLFQFRRYL